MLTFKGTCCSSCFLSLYPALSLLPTCRCQTMMSHAGCSHKFHFKPTTQRPTCTHLGNVLWINTFNKHPQSMSVCAHVFLCCWIKCLCTYGHTHSLIYGFQHLVVKYVWPKQSLWETLVILQAWWRELNGGARKWVFDERKRRGRSREKLKNVPSFSFYLILFNFQFFNYLALVHCRYYIWHLFITYFKFLCTC